MLIWEFVSFSEFQGRPHQIPVGVRCNRRTVFWERSFEHGYAILVSENFRLRSWVDPFYPQIRGQQSNVIVESVVFRTRTQPSPKAFDGEGLSIRNNLDDPLSESFLFFRENFVRHQGNSLRRIRCLQCTGQDRVPPIGKWSAGSNAQKLPCSWDTSSFQTRRERLRNSQGFP